MTTISISGGGNDNVHVHGNAAVYVGNGNDKIDISGNGTVYAGNGNDTVTVDGSHAYVNVGNGNDQINVKGNGTIIAGSGHDTINIGSGNDTITVLGQATIHGAFGTVTVDGGTTVINQGHSGGHGGGTGESDGNRGSNAGESHLHGPHSVAGGHSSFVHGQGASAPDHAAGHPMAASAEQHGVAQIPASHVVSNFVSGSSQMHIEGQALSYLPAHNEVSTAAGNTHIGMAGGHTTVELKGITGLPSGGSHHS